LGFLTTNKLCLTDVLISHSNYVTEQIVSGGKIPDSCSRGIGFQVQLA